MDTFILDLCATRDDIRRFQSRTPTERLAARHAIRARDMNGGRWNGSWSATQWERLVAFVGSICYWCGEHTDQPVPDHYVPLARGGRNSIDNLVVSCPHCNSQRQDKLPDEYWVWLDDQPDDCQQTS